MLSIPADEDTLTLGEHILSRTRSIENTFKDPKERERERERERALLGTTVHNGGSRAAPERERVWESLQANQNQ